MMIKSNSNQELALSINSLLVQQKQQNLSKAQPNSGLLLKQCRNLNDNDKLYSSEGYIHKNARSNSKKGGQCIKLVKRGKSRKVGDRNKNNSAHVVNIAIDDTGNCFDCSNQRFSSYTTGSECNHPKKKHKKWKTIKNSDDDSDSSQLSEEKVESTANDENNSLSSNTKKDSTHVECAKCRLNNNCQSWFSANLNAFGKDMIRIDSLRYVKPNDDEREDPLLVNCRAAKLSPHRYSGVEANSVFECKDSSTDNSFAFKNAKFKRRHSQPPMEFQTEAPDIITINVAGMRFQTYNSTLARYPNSLLGDSVKRKKYWNEAHNEYFLDRHRTAFESILHIYQAYGQVIRPEAVPISLFLKELAFYEMGSEVIENFWISEGYQKPNIDIMPNNKCQRKIWQLMEHPDSSIVARILAFISISVIIISIVSFCLETIPELKRDNDSVSREWSSPFFWIEFVCSLWFSVELVVRFGSSPSKSVFMKSFLNVLDFVAIAPFFINLLFINGASNETSPTIHSSSLSFSVLRVIRLVRVFRIFKLSRHSVGLQVLGKTFRASVQEFCLLIFFMAIALVLFSSGVYFAEQNEPNTKFTSIPASFWFVLATMTTVGYGDLVPQGLYGKIVGSVCALIGVLTLALPVPIIVANFKHFYRQECRLAQLYRQEQQVEPEPIVSPTEENCKTSLPNHLLNV